MFVAAAAVTLLLLMGLFAPLESFGWWAGWYGGNLKQAPAVPPDRTLKQRTHFVVYLTGIGGSSPDVYSPREAVFLAKLREALPDAEIVDDIFPYSNANRALTGQRFFGPLWRLLENLKGRGPLGLLTFIVNVRNLWQVLVSSDDRFGPLYNHATAELVLKKLAQHGYVGGSGVPVTFIGYSGGGQISLGAAPFVKDALGAPTRVISLGGVMSGERGVLVLDGLTHLYGDRDVTQRLGPLLFPQRWPLLGYSAWNRARKQGLVRRVAMGPMGHTGRNSYLDADAVSEGESFLGRTTKTIVGLVQRDERVGG